MGNQTIAHAIRSQRGGGKMCRRASKPR